jgi:hypothetical protein
MSIFPSDYQHLSPKLHIYNLKLFKFVGIPTAKQGANLSGRSNQLTAPDKHKNLCGRALKTALVYSVNEI